MHDRVRLENDARVFAAMDVGAAAAERKSGRRFGPSSARSAGYFGEESGSPGTGEISGHEYVSPIDDDGDALAPFPIPIRKQASALDGIEAERRSAIRGRHAEQDIESGMTLTHHCYWLLPATSFVVETFNPIG
ncbi:hypothetical protein PG999_003242 [Apiospora kogelbergensis]|uniref:Uncharacterized protein n=1 Tax=Apiospora kogelbergensis TaxID=1337665 RepID=A0AAW0R319_9PEZI